MMFLSKGVCAFVKAPKVYKKCQIFRGLRLSINSQGFHCSSFYHIYSLPCTEEHLIFQTYKPPLKIGSTIFLCNQKRSKVNVEMMNTLALELPFILRWFNRCLFWLALAILTWMSSIELIYAYKWVSHDRLITGGFKPNFLPLGLIWTRLARPIHILHPHTMALSLTGTSIPCRTKYIEVYDINN